MRIRNVIGSVFATISLAAATVGDQPGFIGKWVSVDSQTGGLKKLVISGSGPKCTARAWADCQPAECDWGESTVALIASSVTDSHFDRGLAIWEQGFATKYMNLTMEGRELAVEIITIFKDGSPRSNYRTYERMRQSRE